ncbi:MAG: DUF305 domain-containing protein [Thermoanaerobaculia bacterium]
MMKLKRSSALLLGLVFMATTAVTQTMAHEGHHGMDHDVMFADGMTKHHRDGIKMAQMAVEKAQNAELRSMAQKMIDDQSREIDEMQRLRGDAPMTPMAEMMKMPGMMPESMMQQDMARLEAATGQAFDIAFTEIMPKHHDEAIKMSKHELANGDNSGLRAIAQEIADKQSRER